MELTVKLQVFEGPLDLLLHLLEKNSHEARHPASVTKIMTLLLIFDALSSKQISLDDTVTVSEYAASMGGSQVFLEPGETQTVETMIKCISVASANDACVAMAEHVAGSESEFVRMMNERAKGLGMNDTNFVNCCCLDAGKITSVCCHVLKRSLVNDAYRIRKAFFNREIV